MAIQSIQRAFDILQALDQINEPARAAIIAEQIDLPRTTVIRMLATLEDVGAVQRVSGSNAYQIGTAVSLLGQPKTSRNKLKALAKPEIEQLAHATGETVYFCVPAGSQVYYLDQINSRHHILLRDWTDTYVPAHATAAGKVFLAYLSANELEAYLTHPLKRFTPKTITEPNKIRAYTKKIRQRGVGWTHGQTEEGLVGVAAPVFNRNQAVKAAVSLGGPAFRFPKPNKQEATAQAVVETAQRITAKL